MLRVSGAESWPQALTAPHKGPFGGHSKKEPGPDIWHLHPQGSFSLMKLLLSDVEDTYGAHMFESWVFAANGRHRKVGFVCSEPCGSSFVLSRTSLLVSTVKTLMSSSRIYLDTAAVACTAQLAVACSRLRGPFLSSLVRCAPAVHHQGPAARRQGSIWMTIFFIHLLPVTIKELSLRRDSPILES